VKPISALARPAMRQLAKAASLQEVLSMAVNLDERISLTKEMKLGTEEIHGEGEDQKEP
jgi:hypothetical protein